MCFKTHHPSTTTINALRQTITYKLITTKKANNVIKLLPPHEPTKGHAVVLEHLVLLCKVRLDALEEVVEVYGRAGEAGEPGRKATGASSYRHAGTVRSGEVRRVAAVVTCVTMGELVSIVDTSGDLIIKTCCFAIPVGRGGVSWIENKRWCQFWIGRGFLQRSYLQQHRLRAYTAQETSFCQITYENGTEKRVKNRPYNRLTISFIFFCKLCPLL